MSRRRRWGDEGRMRKKDPVGFLKGENGGNETETGCRILHLFVGNINTKPIILLSLEMN